jgi:hypothetical protein
MILVGVAQLPVNTNAPAADHAAFQQGTGVIESGNYLQWLLVFWAMVDTAQPRQ